MTATQFAEKTADLEAPHRANEAVEDEGLFEDEYNDKSVFKSTWFMVLMVVLGFALLSLAGYHFLGRSSERLAAAKKQEPSQHQASINADTQPVGQLQKKAPAHDKQGASSSAPTATSGHSAEHEDREGQVEEDPVEDAATESDEGASEDVELQAEEEPAAESPLPAGDADESDEEQDEEPANKLQFTLVNRDEYTSYKELHVVDERKSFSQLDRQAYPNDVQVVFVPTETCKSRCLLDTSFNIPSEWTVSQMKEFLKNDILGLKSHYIVDLKKEKDSQDIDEYLTLEELQSEKDEDGFLYILYDFDEAAVEC